MNISRKAICTEIFLLEHRKLTSIWKNKVCSVEKDRKRKLGELLALIGFLMVPLGGLGYSFFSLESTLGVISAVTGFLLFLGGAELALRNGAGHESSESSK